ncbi:MAG: DUF4260 domain-containing protein [Paracoccaceae bacterium]
MTTPPGTTRTWPRAILQTEGAALFAAATFAYAQTGGSWWLFAILLLSPDIAMLGYLHNPRTGAALYNLAHSTTLPLALILAGWLASPLALSLGLIWLAHVGFDRAAGYGLKYGDAFKHTHLSAPAYTTTQGTP